MATTTTSRPALTPALSRPQAGEAKPALDAALDDAFLRWTGSARPGDVDNGRAAFAAGYAHRSRVIATRRLAPLPPGVTRRELDVLRTFAGLVERLGCAPTYQEVADALGVSKPVVFEHFENLRRKGCLRRHEGHKARNHELAVVVPDADPVGEAVRR